MEFKKSLLSGALFSTIFLFSCNPQKSKDDTPKTKETNAVQEKNNATDSYQMEFDLPKEQFNLEVDLNTNPSLSLTNSESISGKCSQTENPNQVAGSPVSLAIYIALATPSSQDSGSFVKIDSQKIMIPFNCQKISLSLNNLVSNKKYKLFSVINKEWIDQSQATQTLYVGSSNEFSLGGSAKLTLQSYNPSDINMKNIVAIFFSNQTPCTTNCGQSDNVVAYYILSGGFAPAASPKKHEVQITDSGNIRISITKQDDTVEIKNVGSLEISLVRKIIEQAYEFPQSELVYVDSDSPICADAPTTRAYVKNGSGEFVPVWGVMNCKDERREDNMYYIYSGFLSSLGHYMSFK